MKKQAGIFLVIVVLALVTGCDLTDQIVPGLIVSKIIDSSTIELHNNSAVSSVTYLKMAFHDEKFIELSQIVMYQGPASQSRAQYTIPVPAKAKTLDVIEYKLSWDM